MLDEAIREYLLWMREERYKEGTLDKTKTGLNYFSHFIAERNINKEIIFTFTTLQAFQEQRPRYIPEVRGLWRYLYNQGRITQALEKEKEQLPDVYEEYLLYYDRLKQVHTITLLGVRRVLFHFNEYLTRERVSLPTVKIKDLDAFLTEYNAGFTPKTQQNNRSNLRGFIRYLYQVRGIVRKDLASLIVGAPLYAQAKPPKFLRPEEVQKLFGQLKNSSSRDLRVNAMLYLAFHLGLRPKEISLISLDDISFRQKEIYLPDRKGRNPMKLPLTDETLKAIAAYIIGVRVKSKERALFWGMKAPHAPIPPFTVCRDIALYMRRANLSATPYWLRHTYAQNLLENGVSIFEIKEMLGHDHIQTTEHYLHIHTTLMREVLFDETL